MNAHRLLRLISIALSCLTATAHAAPGQVQLPVPRVTIYPGQAIDRAMLVQRAFRDNGSDLAASVPSSEALVGKVARQTLLPGRPIGFNAIREPHAVTQGQATVIVFQSGALTITGSAIALQSGAAGDVVSVRNADSGRIIKGTIGPDGSVHVGDP